MEIKKNEIIAANRLMYFHLVNVTDGITPEDGEADGQPQLSVNGGDGVDTNGVLVKIVDMPGDYYVLLTQSEVDLIHRDIIQGTYKSPNTAQMPAVIIQIIDPTIDEINIGKVKGISITDINDFKADINTLSTFNSTTDEVDIGKVKGSDVTSVNDFKVDISSLSLETTSQSIKNQTDQLAFDSTTGLLQVSITSTGNNLVTLTLYETDGSIPIPNVNIIVKNSDDTIEHTHVITDINGQATFYADNATFKLRISKSMYAFSTSETIIVIGDTIAPIIYGTPIIKTVTITPGLQTIYGRIIKVDETPDIGQLVSAKVITPTKLDNALLSRSKLSAVTDENGDFEIQVIKGAKILLSMTNYFSETVTITQDNTKDFLDYVSVDLS